MFSRAFMRHVLTAVILFAAAGYSPAADEETWYNVPLQTGVDALSKAIAEGDEAACEKLYDQRFRSTGLGSMLTETIPAVNLRAVRSAAASGHGMVRQCACILLMLDRGYESNTALLAAVHDGTPAEVAAASYSLAGSQGDPRTGPALLDAYRRLTADEDYEESLDVVDALGVLRYRPAAQCIRARIAAATQGKWWTSPAARREVDCLFDGLGEMGDRHAPALYNSVLTDAVRVLREGANSGQRQGLSYGLFLAGGNLADMSTMHLFVDMLKSPDFQVAYEQYPYDEPNDWEPPAPDMSLHAAAMLGIGAALPWEASLTVAEYESLLGSVTDLESIYVQEFRKIVSRPADPQSVMSATHMLRRLLARSRVEVIPEAESYLLNQPEDLTWILETYASALAGLGSWEATDWLLSVAEKGGPYADHAAMVLRWHTSNDFDARFDVWRWWIGEAKKQLTWDLDTRAFTPLDKWDALEKEALTRLTAPPVPAPDVLNSSSSQVPAAGARP